jgi:hypothetical protein
MATLKMKDDSCNDIWLTGVKRVETMYYFQPEIDHMLPNEYPWEYAKRILDRKLKEEPNSRLLRNIESRILDHENHSAIIDNSNGNHLVIVYVAFEDMSHRGPENWLVWKGANYLLENGKTVDRI